MCPCPSAVPGLTSPIIDLAGPWSFTTSPEKNFWAKGIDLSAWSTVHVPGEFVLQDFDIIADTEYPCRRTITIPKDFTGHKIFLRFDGVYGYARVWVNGTYIRDHRGGFTSWDCEITAHVTPGEAAEIVLGITDSSDDISQASYYAKHSIAGILRKVQLIALPAVHLGAFSANASLNAAMTAGTIEISAELSAAVLQNAHLELHLAEEEGKQVPLTPTLIHISAGAPAKASLAVANPNLWDAEHPRLYTLVVDLIVDGAIVQTLRRTLGFRTVEIASNQLLVNGRPVKLRGVCRHSIHPFYGRAVPVEFDEQDAILFRQANINFIRTSHYPPTPEFLEACDRHGLYVEEETAVSWSNLGDGPSSDPAYTSRFLRQFAEMIDRDRAHACVVFWSLGNESQWGTNFAMEREHARAADPTRPLIFSYPDTVPLGAPAADIYSKHYPDAASNLGSDDMPVLHDEFAHVPCYNLDTLRRDPGVRNFWGESIKRFGDAFLATEGCLGGSIWAGIDEVFLLKDRAVGYGPWGIIDGWRRPKPEYWLTQKAFSPIRIADRELALPAAQQQLQIQVYNAFDHTNLGEITIEWTLAGVSGRLSNVDIPPRQPGLLTIPHKNISYEDVLELRFLRADSQSLIDHFKLPFAPQSASSATTSSTIPALPLNVTVNASGLLIAGNSFEMTVPHETGLLSAVKFRGNTVIQEGPFLDLGFGYLKLWTLRKFDYTASPEKVTLYASGESRESEGPQKIKLDLEIDILASGAIHVRYKPTGPLVAKASHIGLAFMLPPGVEQMEWKRRSLWSVYPEDHIGRPSGTASRKPSVAPPPYRVRPDAPWSQDCSELILAPMKPPAEATHDFCAIKENIWTADCIFASGKYRLRVHSAATVAARATPWPNGRTGLSIFNYWSYPDMEWGNYTGPSPLPATASHEVKLLLTD